MKDNKIEATDSVGGGITLDKPPPKKDDLLISALGKKVSLLTLPEAKRLVQYYRKQEKHIDDLIVKAYKILGDALP